MPRREHIETDCSSSSSTCRNHKQCDCVPKCKGGMCRYDSSSCSSTSSTSSSSRDCNQPIPCDDSSSSSEACCDKPRAKDLLPKDPDCYECPPVRRDEPCKGKGKGCEGCKKCVDECPDPKKCKKNPIVTNPNKFRKYFEGRTCSDSSSSSSESSCGPIIVPKLGPGYQQQCEFVEKVSKSSSSSSEECDLIPLGCPFSHKGRDCGQKKCVFCCEKRGSKKRTKKHDKKKDDMKCRTFWVDFVNKSGAPWSHRITSTDLCISVNKEKGPDIHLTRGHYYRFMIKGSTGMNFYFTIDPQGGPIGECADSPYYDPLPIHGTPSPTGSGEIILHATKQLPKSFYYQCKTHRCMGGRVFIHDSK